MSHRLKWFSAVLSVLMIASFVLAPTVISAEKPDKSTFEGELKKQEIPDRVKEAIERGAFRDPTPSGSDGVKVQAVGEVHYSGKVDDFTQHVYYFETNAKGQVAVEDRDPTSKTMYAIFNLDTGYWYTSNSDHTTFTLEAGRYQFVVWNNGLISVDYDYVLSGSTVTYAPEELPRLEVTQRANSFVHLPKNSTSFTVSGNTDVADLRLTMNRAIEHRLQPPNFHVSIPVSIGDYEMALKANHANGNTVQRDYVVFSSGTKRLGGKNRYDVSANVSKEIQSNRFRPETIFLSRGDLFTDALSGVPLASSENGVMLLTKTDTLPDAIKTEIQQLKPSRAVILGGPLSVSTNVESQLKQMGIKVERIGGKDRYDVSAKVADRVLRGLGAPQNTVFVASGQIFTDALSASGVAANDIYPILLVKKDAVPASIQTFLKNHPEIKKAIIVGGPKTVSTVVESQLKQMGLTVDRIGGANRYEVSVNVAKKFGPFRYLVFARGDVFADALSGGLLCREFAYPWEGGTIMLTPSTKLSPYTEAYLAENEGDAIAYAYLLGGEVSITPELAKRIDSYIPYFP